jgi:hypothetical protein
MFEWIVVIGAIVCGFAAVWILLTALDHRG